MSTSMRMLLHLEVEAKPAVMRIAFDRSIETVYEEPAAANVARNR